MHARTHTCTYPTHRHKKGAGMYSRQFHTSFLCPLFSHSLRNLLPQTTSCCIMFACGETSHVEKCRTTCNTVGKLVPLCIYKKLHLDMFIYMKWTTVPYLLTVLNQTLSTPSIIHAACICDSCLVCFFLGQWCSRVIESPS